MQTVLSRALTLALAAASLLGATGYGMAGNEANFVLYSHRTEAAGELEVNVFSDFSHGVRDLPSYGAQLYEIEYAWTDQFVTALYLEGDKTNGSDSRFGGWRAEARYRPFAYGTFLNPVLYAEYEHLDPNHRYRLDVLGRTDHPDPLVPPTIENALELKLILGQDLGRGFDIALNAVAEMNTSDHHWEYGYAAGLNYTLWRAGRDGEGAGKPKGSGSSSSSGWEVRTVKLGLETYGGLGDSTLGFTANSHVTEQFAGVNVQTKFANGMQMTVGAAAGLTPQSEHAIVRMMLGYEIK